MKLTGTLFTTALILTVLNQAGMWQTSAFVSGVAHPLLGMDHILVMMAVGLWAVLLGRRALWVFPLTFLAMMLAGFAAASFGFGLRFVEPAIALSIIVIGLLVAFAVKAPVWFGSVITSTYCLLSWTCARERKRQWPASLHMRLVSLSSPRHFMQSGSPLGFAWLDRSDKSPFRANGRYHGVDRTSFDGDLK